jgi:phosphatidylinositol alpha-1,6-mannosyltransferase
VTNRAPHLAIVTNDYPPRAGGIQQYLGNLADAYPGEVTVLAPADGPASETVRGESVVRRHDARFMWPTPRVARWLVGQLGDIRPDAVLFGAPHPLTALIPRVRSVVDGPVAVLCHGAEVTVPAAVPGLRRLLTSWLRNADLRFAVSRFTADRVQRLTGCDVRYVGGAVDVERFVPISRREDHEVAVVGCVSRFVPRKGQRRLIDAVARLGDRGITVRLVLVGRGRTLARLRRRVAHRGVDAEFAVDVPWGDLPSIHASFDVFAMPCRSRWGGLEVEGLGLVYLEAAASGVPVVAGRSGGAPETVVPGQTGYLAESVSEVTTALERLVTNPVRAREMGADGRRRVVAEFTWERVVDRLVEGLTGV